MRTTICTVPGEPALPGISFYCIGKVTGAFMNSPREMIDLELATPDKSTLLNLRLKYRVTDGFIVKLSRLNTSTGE